MSMMDSLAQADAQAFEAIEKELNRQRTKLELIASENIVSRAVMEAQGSVLTNKYAEGYPGKRYYGGCEYVDIVEQLAIDRAKELFGAAWANVQPHSGAQANMAVFFALLSPGDTILGMNLTDGGHLTHGSPVNISGSYFKVIPYGVDKETERIDYDALERLANEQKPKMIIAGASAYARTIDFERIAAADDGNVPTQHDGSEHHPGAQYGCGCPGEQGVNEAHGEGAVQGDGARLDALSPARRQAGEQRAQGEVNQPGDEREVQAGDGDEV